MVGDRQGKGNPQLELIGLGSYHQPHKGSIWGNAQLLADIGERIEGKGLRIGHQVPHHRHLGLGVAHG